MRESLRMDKNCIDKKPSFLTVLQVHGCTCVLGHLHHCYRACSLAILLLLEFPDFNRIFQVLKVQHPILHRISMKRSEG